MSTPSDSKIIKKRLKKLIAENDLEKVFEELDQIISDSSDLDNTFIQLQRRYNQAQDQNLKDIISNSEYNQEINKISNALITYIDDLEPDDLNLKDQPATSEHSVQQGFVDYYIPTKMKIDEPTPCSIRISWDENNLKRELPKGWDSKQKPLQVSAHMLASLYNHPDEPAFRIAMLNKEEKQVVIQGMVTEWRFDVTPLKEGTFPLILNIAVIITLKEEMGKIEKVFEEKVMVQTTPVDNKEGLGEGQDEPLFRAGFMFSLGPIAPAVAEEKRKKQKQKNSSSFSPTAIGAAALGVVALVGAVMLFNKDGAPQPPYPPVPDTIITVGPNPPALPEDSPAIYKHEIDSLLGSIDELDTMIQTIDKVETDLENAIQSMEAVFKEQTTNYIYVKDQATPANTYKALRLADGNIWLVENLRYDVGAGSWCYDDASSCRTYGRLYDYGAAEKACQALQGGNWQLPTEEQWRKLIESYGSGQAAYRALIDGGRSSFGAKLAGYSTATKADTPDYSGKDSQGHYWSGSNKTSIIFWQMDNSIEFTQRAESFGLSCRCIKVK